MLQPETGEPLAAIKSNSIKRVNYMSKKKKKTASEGGRLLADIVNRTALGYCAHRLLTL